MVTRRELTEPEALVWAAAFASALQHETTPSRGTAIQDAVWRAHHAVTMLRSARVRDRRDMPMIRMLCDFRMDHTPVLGCAACAQTGERCDGHDDGDGAV